MDSRSCIMARCHYNKGDPFATRDDHTGMLHCCMVAHQNSDNNSVVFANQNNVMGVLDYSLGVNKIASWSHQLYSQHNYVCCGSNNWNFVAHQWYSGNPSDVYMQGLWREWCRREG